MRLKTRLTLPLICLLCFAMLSFCACSGVPDQFRIVRLRGEQKTVTVALDDPTGAGLVLSASLNFTNGGENTIAVYPLPAGESPYAVVSYPADFEDYGFSAAMTGNMFRLETEQDCQFTTDAFHVTVYADITAYELVGSHTLTAALGDQPMQTLRLDLTGGAAVDIRGIAAEAVAVHVEGAADIVLAGQAIRLDAEINGAGALESTKLAVSHAAVTINGVGAAEIACAETLDAEINGAGSIAYVGDPVLTKEINGAGAVTKRADNAL